MGDFDKFTKHIKTDSLMDVMDSFQADFLERVTDGTEKWRPVHLASMNGSLEILRFFLQNKCNIECEDWNKWRPIHFACQKGHLDIAKLLLANDCIVECEDLLKWRPIHFACQKGHLDIVKELLQNKCSIESENNRKWRPIHFALHYGHLGVVQFLCQNNCELDCKTKNGETPMAIAKKAGHQLCENFLNEVVKRRQNIFDCVRRNDAEAFNGLYSPEILTMEDHKAGLSILEVAFQSNANEIIDYLLNKLIGAEEISLLENHLKNCSRPGAVQIIKECLLYRSIRFHNADGFHLSCSAKTINEHGKLVKTSFVETAAEFGCKPFINDLLKKSIYNEEEWTKAKDLATLQGHDEITKAISNRVNLLRKRADKNITWLHSAVCDNDPDMIQYILGRNLVNPDFNNEVVGTGLALAHLMCYDQCIEVLEKFNVDVNTQNKYSQSPLHEAIASGMTDHCSYLISRARDIDVLGFMGFTGLQCAVIKGYETVCGELLKNGADCVRYVEIQPQSSLNNTTILPISKSENAVTLCMKIHETIYPCFLEALDSEKIKCSDGDGNSLLHMAVKCLQPDLCSTLIKSGSDVEAINDRGNGPMFELFNPAVNQDLNDKVKKSIETLNVLIEAGVDVNKISQSGMTIFQGASQWNSERLLVSLLSSQSQVTCVTEKDFKLAFTKNWFEYASALISHMTEDSLQAVITTDVFHLAIPHADSQFLMSLFAKSTRPVQHLVIEDLLNHLASKQEYSNFVDLLNYEIGEPKLFDDGETLLTSLLKKKNSEYCWALINCATNKRCIILENKAKETPLQIAIECELFDLLNPLIFNCDEELEMEFNWHSPLMPLFKKLSVSKDDNIADQKLLAAIKAIICKGGDIYKEILGGAKMISHCSRFKEKIEIFQSTVKRSDRPDKNVCSVCLDKEVDCVFDCGHTYCMECGTQLYRCAICNSDQTNPKKLYFN